MNETPTWIDLLTDEVLRELTDLRRNVPQDKWASIVDEIENFINYTDEEFQDYEAMIDFEEE